MVVLLILAIPRVKFSALDARVEPPRELAQRLRREPHRLAGELQWIGSRLAIRPGDRQVAPSPIRKLGV